jgi:hypothetical protein
MKRNRTHRKLLDESCAWLREHWNATNLDVPEALRERWMYEPAEDCMNPEGFHLAVFTFGLLQYDLISKGVPEGVQRSYSAQTLLSLFSHWQLKLALAEVHRCTNLRIRALPLFAFPENEQVEAWCDQDSPVASGASGTTPSSTSNSSPSPRPPAN